MNLAIIVAVSEYADVRNNLPGCKKDAESIYNIVNKIGKYDEVLFIYENLSSAKIKEKLTDFISSHKSNKVEELFFYYTGHGEFQNDEFYYILSDYNQDKKKQTSLQNEEVDVLFKTLKPDLVVKVIDACQSGKSYIKEAGAITKYFNNTSDRFNRCYFLNSSLKDQSSFQTDVISDFTLSFINAIKEHNTDEIRYKDIIDYISDDFENNPSQTPFFVVQADYTEKFCIINDALKEFLSNLNTTLQTDLNSKENNASLIEKIKKDATEYLGKEDALQLIEDLKSETETLILSKDLEEIFDLSVSFKENYDGVVKRSVVGKWLDENPHDYFAKSSHTRLRKDRNSQLITPGLRLSHALFADDSEYESVRNGFELEVEVPYKAVFFTLQSKFPNVDSYTARAVYLLSKKQIRFFYFITNFETKNWDDKKLNDNIKWFTTEYALSDKQGVIEGLKKIFIQLEDKIRDELAEKFVKDEKFDKKEVSAEKKPSVKIARKIKK